jgi:hypothetical protein
MASHIERRKFLATLGGAAAWPRAARAQQAGMPVIGSLFSVSAAQWEDKMAGFRRGLGEAGFVNGRNVTIDHRWADGQLYPIPCEYTSILSARRSHRHPSAFLPVVRAEAAHAFAPGGLRLLLSLGMVEGNKRSSSVPPLVDAPIFQLAWHSPPV